MSLLWLWCSCRKALYIPTQKADPSCTACNEQFKTCPLTVVRSSSVIYSGPDLPGHNFAILIEELASIFEASVQDILQAGSGQQLNRQLC